MRSSDGFLFAVAGFALLTCGDAVIKSMAGQWPAPAVAALRFTLALPLLFFMVKQFGGKAGFALRRPWVQFGRGFCASGSAILFFISLFAMPLAEATAIVFVSPVITAIISAILLKEGLPRIAWIASALALCGVAIILRPNLAEVGLLALLPLGAACFFAMMVVLNRMAVGTGDVLALQWVLALVAAPLLTMAAIGWHLTAVPAFQIGWPENSVIVRCAIVAVTASLSHWLIYQGTVRTSAANAAQAVYVQLPVALLIDAVIFRHWPDIMALIGAGLIILSGLWMWHSNREKPVSA